MTIIEQLRDAELHAIKEWLRPSSMFAAMFYGTLCYMLLKQIPVPEILKQVVSFLMGFYFGQKLPEQKKEDVK